MKDNNLVIDATAKFSADDIHWMRCALQLTATARDNYGEVPVGAVLVLNGEVIGEGCNQNITLKDPTAHAEIVALRAACTHLHNHRLPSGCTLYVTLEPCAMCSMALVHARAGRVVFATVDPRTGAAGSVYDLLRDRRLPHKVEVVAGIREQESADLLKDFFAARR